MYSTSVLSTQSDRNSFQHSAIRQTLVIIDSNVDQHQMLIDDVQAKANVVVLQPDVDGISQISDVLKRCDRITDVHLISHGSPGQLQLGATQLSFETLDQYVDQLKNWSTVLEGADLHLYGCQVAKGAVGYLFLQQLHQLTGAKIAASSQPVGRLESTVNWDLETRLGTLQSTSIFSSELEQNYSSHFVITVTTSSTEVVESEETPFTITFTSDTPLDPLNPPIIELSTTEGAGGLTRFDLTSNTPVGISIDPNIPLGNGFTTVELGILASGANITLPTANVDGPEREEAFPQDVEGVDETVTFNVVLTNPDASGQTLAPGSESFDVTFLEEPAPPPNTDPVAVNDAATTDAGLAVDVTVLGNDTDADGDDLTVDAVGDASDGTTVLNDDGTVTYTPNDGFSGDDSFTYDISDGNGGTATGTVNVTVNEVIPDNTPPEATNDTATTDAGVAVDVAVLGNDTDADGDALTVDAVGDASDGTAVLNDDGTVTYTPNDGFTGDDSFTYDISDGNGGTATGTVNVTVNEVIPDNTPPEATNDTATTDAGVAVDVAVLGNDTDADGDALTVDAVGDASDGTAVLNDDGTVTYTPNDGFTGDDSFTYDISDGNGGTATGTVNVTVNEVIPENTPPEATNDTATTDAGVAVDVAVLGNDTDADGDDLTVDAVGDASDGTAVLNDDATVTYTPNDGFTGDDSFTYDISDGNGGTATGTVNVTVEEISPPPPENTPPEAADDTATTDAGVAVDVAVLGNDTDADGDALTVDAVGDATNGTAVLNDDGTVTYTPNDGFTGDDSFTYDISDGNGGTATGTVNVAVEDGDGADVPVVGVTADVTEVTEGEEVTFNFNVEGEIPEEGLAIAIGSSDIAANALDLDPAILDAGTPDGFAGPPTFSDSNIILTLTEPDASLTVTLAEDDVDEGTETIDFFIENSDLYDVDPANSTVELSVSDADIPVPEILGTNDRDLLRGTNDGETIKALGGKDIIFAKGGDDDIHANAGNDQVFGGSGNDLIFGNRGRDIVLGQLGNDRISGGFGNDTLLGGRGSDVLSGDSGRDVIIGGQGDDLLMGVTGDDRLLGGLGSDTFVFGNGDGTDTVFDFQDGEDLIGLVDGELAFANLDISQSGFITTLGVTGTGETLARLVGVSAGDLTEDDFVIVPDVSDLSTLPDDAPFI